MAKTGYACLLFLLVVASFSQHGLGAGTVHVFIRVEDDIARRATLTFVNGSTATVDLPLLPQGKTAVYDITDDIVCVRTLYLPRSGPGFNDYKVVLDWCTHSMPFNCLPDCFWIILDFGFSVAKSTHSPLHFAGPWIPLNVTAA